MEKKIRIQNNDCRFILRHCLFNGLHYSAPTAKQEISLILTNLSVYRKSSFAARISTYDSAYASFGVQNYLLLNISENPCPLPCLIFNQKSILLGAQNVPYLKNMLFLRKILKKKILFKKNNRLQLFFIPIKHRG